MITVDERYCKGCGICVRFCPKHLLELASEVNSLGYYAVRVVDASKCTNCNQCVLLCPDFAIFTAEEEEDGDG